MTGSGPGRLDLSHLRTKNPARHLSFASGSNVYNFRTLLQGEPLSYQALRFDPNNDCNLHCVYCHNHRSKETIDATDDFAAFLHSKVISVATFQTGCIMEPTLDGRLADLLLMVAHSPAKPTHEFILQTNG
jgi:sulfatase maturation enzyme AslB (radical SAM superfamily)